MSRPTLHSMVARVGKSILAEELFLDQPRADETAKRIGATSLVIGTASTGTTEGLLSD
jgi:putative N-acetylmannosamine-6-phosphate epimerase